MKSHQKLVLFLSASFLAITTMLYNPYLYKLNEVENKDNVSQNDNDLNFNNENILEETNSYELDQIKTITTTFFNSLNDKNTYYFEPNKSYIENKINHSKLILNGELNFDSTSLSSYNLNGIYSYSNSKEFINLTLTKESNLTSLTINNSSNVLVKKNKDINSTFAFFEGNLKEENPYSSKSLGRSNLDMLNSSSLGLTTIFNEAFIELETSKEDEIAISYIDSLNEYKIDTSSYSLYFDSSYNLKRLTNNSSLSRARSKASNFDIDLLFTNKINSVDDLINEASSIFDTLFEYLKGTSLSSLLDITLDDSKNNKTFHFVGDMSLDFTNYDLADNGIIDLNLKHYTNGNTANDIFLRYQDTDIFFKDGDLIQGRMEDKTIGETIKSLDNLLDNNLISQYIDNPLNNIFNNDEFKDIFDSIENMDLDLLSLFDSLKNLEVRHNVISFDMDGSNFNLPRNLIHFEIGLANLKLKTLKISNLKINDDMNLELKVRIMPFKNLVDLDLKDYPSYDFIPGALDSIDRLLRSRKLGGSLSLNVISKDGAHTLISSNIDADLSDVDFNNLETITDADIALTNLTLNDVDKDGNPTSVQQSLNDMGLFPLNLYLQKTAENEETLFIDLNALIISLFGVKIDLTDEYGKMQFDLDLIGKLIGNASGDSSIISSILSFLGLENLDFSNISELFETLITLISTIGINEDLEKIIEKITDDYSLLALQELAGEYPFIYNDGYNFIININPEVLFGYDMDTTYGDTTTSSSNYVAPTISLSWNTNLNRLNNVFINFEIPETRELDSKVIQLSYSYDYFDKSILLTNSQMSEFKPVLSTFSNIFNEITASKYSLLTPNKYALNLGLNNTPNLIDATLGLKDDKYAEGKVKINTQSSIFNNPEFQFIYDNRYQENLSKISSLQKRYFDGNVVYEDIISGLEKFKEGTLQANIKLDTINFPDSKLKVYSSANSLFDIVTNVLEISNENILYPYIQKLLNFIENLFSGNSILLFQIIEQGGIESLLKLDFLKDLQYSITSSNIYLRLEIIPELFASSDANTQFEKNFIVELSFDYQKNNKDTYQITLKHLLIDAPVLSKINNFRLELKDTEEKFHEPLESESGSSTSYSVLDNTFEAYDPNNKDEFVNLDDVKKLVQMGINTTEYKFFELNGILNLNINVFVISGLFDLNKFIEPQYVNAKVELLKPDGSDLYSKTRAHLTLNRNNYGLYKEDAKYVEFFTERTDEGKEIAYIASTKAKIVSEHQETIKEPEEIFTSNETDDNSLINHYKELYPNHDVKRLETKKELIEEKWGNLEKEYNKLTQEHPNWTLEYEPSLFKKSKIYKQLYKYTINTYGEYAIIREHSSYEIEMFKVEQSELLGSTNQIPNLIYYLLEYSMAGNIKAKDWWVLPPQEIDKSIIVGYINNTIAKSSNADESSNIDFISAIGKYSSTDSEFALEIDLSKLISFDGLNGLNISVGYGNDLNGNLVLQNLTINGTGENDTIIKNSIFFDVSLRFEATAFLKKHSSNEFDRYEHFINAFKSNVETNFLDYHKITGYSEDNVAFLGNILIATTNDQKITLSISELETGINAGFIYGLDKLFL